MLDLQLVQAAWNHPLKTSIFFRGVGVKSFPNLLTEISKNMPTEGGRGQKSSKFADVLNGRSFGWLCFHSAAALN